MRALSLSNTRRMSSSLTGPFSALSLDPPTTEQESTALQSRIDLLTQFFSLPRFASLTRPYTPSSVASKQGTLPPLPLPSTLLAEKLWSVLERASGEGRPVHTLGAVDPVQMTQMAEWLEVVYVSGWACSSVLTTANNEVGPDLAYVPSVVSMEV